MKGITSILKQIRYDALMILLISLTFLKFTGYMGDEYFKLIVLIAILLITLRSEIIYIIPIALVAQMSFGEMRDNEEVTRIFGVIILTLLLYDILKNRRFKRTGYLLLPLALLTLSQALSTINGINFYSNYVGFVQIAVVLILYLYFVNTLDHKSTFINIGKMFMYLGILVTFEMLYVIYDNPLEPMQVIQRRMIDLGWENLNIIIYINLIAIPLIAYNISQSKLKLPYMLAVSFVILGIVLTVSRSSLLSVAVYILFIIPIMLTTDKYRYSLIIQGGIFFVLLFITIDYLEQFSYISDYIETVSGRDFSYMKDRIELLEVAIDNFIKYPIVGSGGLFSSRFLIEEAGYGAINYHNTIAQTLTLGIVGLLSFSFLFIRKFKLLVQSNDTVKWYVIILLIVTAFVNGMFQPMYYYTSYMMYIFLLLALVEVKQKDA